MTYPCHWFSEQVRLAGDLGSTNDVLIPLDCADSEGSIEEVATETMTEPTLGEYMVEVRADYGSNTTTPSDDVDDGPDYLDFINWLNSKFRNHRRMDGRTKNTLWNFLMKGGDNEVLMGDIVSSDNEWKESDNTNHLNDNADLFFKPYLDAQEGNNICTFEKGQEGFDKHKPKTYACNIDELDDILVSNNPSYLINEDEELLNEGICKSKKFEVMRYSLGTTEEYVAINTCEYDA
ncbi:hypothetical protein Tco_0775378 [Tanacetum coccineum]